MKNIILLVTILTFFGCSKNDSFLSEKNELAERKPLWPQNPLPPQLTITNPVAKFVTINGCSGYEWPKIETDTIQLKFSVTSGRKWDGSPDKLSKVRIVVDNVIVKETNITGQNYSETFIVNLPINGLYIPSFDQTKEWHSLGVTVWQSDGNLGSQGLYVWTNK